MKLISGLAAVVLAATTLTTPAAAAPAQANPTADRAVEAGADWLTGQLTDGLVHNDQYGGFDDYGLSADVAFALKAVGRDATAAAIVDAIEPGAESWVAGFAPGRVYAGSLAKFVSVVQATGGDPTTVNGVDQVERLEGLVSTAAPLTGRLEDAGVDPSDPWDADFVNVIGQSFAARALTTADSPVADDATGFLLDQQCNEGFFRATLTADKDSAEQGCDPDVDSGSVDTTAMTVINILDTPGVSTRAKGAAALAASWLRTQQAADGSFSAGGTEGTNANSTGLAGWALAEAGHTTSAARAAGWLRRVQVADLAPCATTLSADNGAVAYQPGVLADARTTGIVPAARDQYRRTTAQALPALVHLPAATGSLAIAVPATAVERSSVTLTVTGLGAGEPACVSLGHRGVPVVGTGDALTVTMELPAGVTAHTFRLSTLRGTSTASTTATAIPPKPAPSVGTLEVSKVERVRKNRVRLAVACAGTGICDGTLTVRTKRKVEGPRGKARKLVVGRATYSVEPGAVEKVVLRVRRPVVRALGARRLPVVATQVAPGVDTVRTGFRLRRS